MRRILFFIYGLVCFLFGNGSLLYMIFFLGNIFVSNSIDASGQGDFGKALLTNSGLILLFAFQHSLMARQSFKKWWRDHLDITVERSTYNLCSAIALILIFYYWQPMGVTIWAITAEWAQVLIYSIYFFGWTLVFVSCFLINYWDLMGLRQVYFNLIKKPYTALDMSTPFFYKKVRHPLYLGFLIAFWATPVMTIAHFLFAILLTIYILFAIRWEEQDLVADFGVKYINYRHRVPKLIPEIRLPRFFKKRNFLHSKK